MPEWPVRGDPMAAPVAESHSRTVVSSLLDAIILPVGSKHAELTVLREEEKPSLVSPLIELFTDIHIITFASSSLKLNPP